MLAFMRLEGEKDGFDGGVWYWYVGLTSCGRRNGKLTLRAVLSNRHRKHRRGADHRPPNPCPWTQALSSRDLCLLPTMYITPLSIPA